MSVNNLELGVDLRPPAVVMNPERLGAMWGSHLSFMRRTLRHIFQNRWQITIKSANLDRRGRGEMVYHIQTHERDLHYIVFSTDIPEAEREDRVIADRWDAATALIEGELTPERLSQLRAGVPRQEYGRADADTLVWSRGNRSSRFFDYVVDQLAQGEQPDVNYLATGGYILRSTAYYANAKFGLTPYDALAESHPLAGAYMAQMLAAFMFREFSIDLAEHLARCRANETGGQAVTLAPEIRRFIGIGNATGMGLVPYVINNPHVVDRWVLTRERSLARIKAIPVSPEAKQLQMLQERLNHYQTYFEADQVERRGIYTAPEILAQNLAQLSRHLADFIKNGTIEDRPTVTPWLVLADYAAAHFDMESQELLHSLLIDLYPEISAEVEHLLDRATLAPLSPEMSLADLKEMIDARYGWALALDLSRPEANHYFWYFSADSEEPLMGVRGVDEGEQVERPLDIPFRVQALVETLIRFSPEESVGWLLLNAPEHRLIVERIQRTAGLTYGEVHTNLMDADVVPLHTQRFQLAQYGMERFNPQSIFWVRVTLLQGAPIAQDLNTANGAVPNWFGFSLSPA